MSASSSAPSRLTATQWLIVTLAAIGFAFDIYELLMAQYIVRPAIIELTGHQPGSKEYGNWASMLLYVPAIAGGIFGLLGGYLTDRLGRRRVLTWSILIYAFSAFAAGFSTSIEMLIFFRATTFVGVCVEFVAAIAWLAELFTDPRQRENVLGYTQAFSSFGGLLVTAVFYTIAAYYKQLPDVVLPSALSFLGEIKSVDPTWRYTLMSGLLPALPLIIIRPFLPESPVWAAKRSAGTLRRPSIAELFSPEFRRTTVVTTIMFACSYGAAFGAIQHLPQIVPGVPEVKSQIEGKTPKERGPIVNKNAGRVGLFQEFGGLAGRFALAILAVRIVSRRSLLRMFQVPGLILMPVIFAITPSISLTALSIGAALAGFFTVAQFSFWGNYLPRVYPVHLRGTGEGFAANIGGRLLGTSFFAVTSQISTRAFEGGSPPINLAYTAAGVAFFVYLVGAIACFWLPEPSELGIADD